LNQEGINLEILKKRKHYFEFQKSNVVTNFSSIQTCSLCPKQVF